MTALRAIEYAPTLPMLAHVERHIRQLGGHYQSGIRLSVLHGLLTSQTQDAIAEDLDMSRRGVEFHVTRVFAAMGVGGSGRHELARIAILRIAAGIDPCWCQVEP